MQALIQLLRDAQDFVFPPLCPACSGRLEQRDEIVCPECRRGIIPLQPPFCSICARRGKQPRKNCCAIPQCGGQLEKARAVCAYEGVTRNLIHQFKYDGRTEIARPLARLMVIAWIEQLDEHRYDCCIPIPLHQSRFDRRGYNQSELLAREFCALSRLPCDPSNLFRSRQTVMQAQLEQLADKIENVRDAFQVRDPHGLHGREILLIDDILTSGATAASCARTLAHAGARRVHLLTFARA